LYQIYSFFSISFIAARRPSYDNPLLTIFHFYECPNSRLNSAGHLIQDAIKASLFQGATQLPIFGTVALFAILYNDKNIKQFLQSLTESKKQKRIEY
jgi:hypothetical protein